MKTLFAVLGFSVACCFACAQVPGAGGRKDDAIISMDADAVKKDARLAKPVTVSLRSAPIKEVLDRFAEQTNVDISIEELDPSSGYNVFVQCDKAPVGKMMDGLYGAFSIQSGEWAWVRTGDPGAYRYTLHETPRAKNRTETYHNILNGALTNFVAVMRDLLPMKMEERKMHTAALRKALFLDNDVTLGGFVDNDDKGWVWYEASFFFNALSRAQQDAVLAGERVTVYLKSLSPEVYNDYHQTYLLSNATYTDPTGKTVAIPEADSVQIFIQKPNLPAGQIQPTIMVVSSTSQHSWMGTGWLQAGIPSAIKRAWILKGDSAIDSAARNVVKEAVDTDAIRKDRDLVDTSVDRFNRTAGARMTPDARERRISAMRAGLGLEARLEQLALGASVPVVAVLPPINPRITSNADRFNTPVGKPVQEFLDHLETSVKRHIYKWRDGVLLVSYPLWFAQQPEAIPYAFLSVLRPDKSGNVSITEWAAFMSDISSDQANWFATEYRYAGNMTGLRQMLLLVDRYPKVLTADGASVDEDTLTRLQAAALLPQRSSGLRDHTRVRIRIDDAGTLAATPTLQFEWHSDQVVRWKIAASELLPKYAAEPKRAALLP